MTLSLGPSELVSPQSQPARRRQAICLNTPTTTWPSLPPPSTIPQTPPRTHLAPPCLSTPWKPHCLPSTTTHPRTGELPRCEGGGRVDTPFSWRHSQGPGTSLGSPRSTNRSLHWRHRTSVQYGKLMWRIENETFAVMMNEERNVPFI